MKRLVVGLLFLATSANATELCYLRGKKAAVVKARPDCLGKEDAADTSRPVWIGANGKFAGYVGLGLGEMIVRVEKRAYRVVVDLASGRFAQAVNGYFDWYSVFEEPGCRGKQWPVPSVQDAALPLALVVDRVLVIPPAEPTTAVHGRSVWDPVFHQCDNLEFNWQVGDFTFFALDVVEPLHVGFE